VLIRDPQRWVNNKARHGNRGRCDFIASGAERLRAICFYKSRRYFAIRDRLQGGFEGRADQ
jgi:hypothetical protein